MNLRIVTYPWRMGTQPAIPFVGQGVTLQVGDVALIDVDRLAYGDHATLGNAVALGLTITDPINPDPSKPDTGERPGP